MATTYIAGNSTSTTIGDLADGDDIYVLPFATLYVTGDSAIESAANANNSHRTGRRCAISRSDRRRRRPNLDRPDCAHG